MDFDLEAFLEIIVGIKPEAIWIGYDSHPRISHLPEPCLSMTQALIEGVRAAGILVKEKRCGKRCDSGYSKGGEINFPLSCPSWRIPGGNVWQRKDVLGLNSF